MFHELLQWVKPIFGGNFGRRPLVHLEPRERWDEADGLFFRNLEWPGEEPPLVMLHGLNSCALTWVRSASLLASGKRRILAPSLRGHGHSALPTGGFALQETRADLRMWLEAWSVRGKVDLVGHSWGGLIAMDYASHFPDSVNSLILADPVPPNGLNPVLKNFSGLIDLAFGPERVSYSDEDSLMEAGRKILYLTAWDDLDRRIWREKFQRSPETGEYRPRLPDEAFRAIVQMTLHIDISAAVQNIRCPILLLRPLFTVSFCPGENRHLKTTGQLTTVSIRGDHTFIHSNAIDTAAAIREFLDK